MSPKQKYIKPRNVQPKISSKSKTEPVKNETFLPKDDQVIHPNLHLDIL